MQENSPNYQPLFTSGRVDERFKTRKSTNPVNFYIDYLLEKYIEAARDRGEDLKEYRDAADKPSQRV